MKGAALLALLAALPSFGRAASFDVSTDYRMRALSYTNLNLNSDIKNDHSFISQQAKLGFAIKNIRLDTGRGEEESMDIAIKLHALGVAGSTTPFPAPFDQIASHYPNTSFVPFIENAYVKLHQLAGVPWDMTLGRQSYRMGSGLLLDDDGAGLTGISVRGALPWWNMKSEGFIFQAKSNQSGGSNLDLFGFSLDLPTEGTWQLNELLEKDRTPQNVPVNACPDPGCAIGHATRWFSSLRYQLNLGPMVFDGEAALEKGAATPTGPAPLANHITYNGNAEVLKAKWKQPLWRGADGIVRLSIARGSGDDASTPSTNEAFFPSMGHRFDGLERSGFGEFFGATPYDAFGGQSTTTANGLQKGTSGIWIFALGATPPAYYGVVMDLDYYIFQADRAVGPYRTLGDEFDLRLRYDVHDRVTLRASAAFFSIGPGSNPTKGSARRYMFEASGRF